MTPKQWAEWERFGVLRWKTRRHQYLVFRNVFRQGCVMQVRKEMHVRGTDPSTWKFDWAYGLFARVVENDTLLNAPGPLMMNALARKIAVERQEAAMRRKACKHDYRRT